MIKSVALVVRLGHHGLNSSYFINLIENIFALCCQNRNTLIYPNISHAVPLSGPYRKIRTTQGANHDAPFQRGPVQLYSKEHIFNIIFLINIFSFNMMVNGYVISVLFLRQPCPKASKDRRTSNLLES